MFYNGNKTDDGGKITPSHLQKWQRFPARLSYQHKTQVGCCKNDSGTLHRYSTMVHPPRIKIIILVPKMAIVR